MNYDLPKLREIALVLENDSKFHADYRSSNLHGNRRNCIKRASASEGFATAKAEREQLRRYLDKLWHLPHALGVDVDPRMAELPTIDIYTDNTPEPQPGRVTDYSQLPDGTRFKLKNGKTVTKGLYTGPLNHVTPRPAIGEFAAWIISDCREVAGHICIRFDGDSSTAPGWAIDEVLPPETQEPQPDHQVTTTKENLMDAIIEITTKTLVNGRDVADMKDSEVYDLIAAQEAKVKELDRIENKPKKLVAEIDKRNAGIQALVSYLDSKV